MPTKPQPGDSFLLGPQRLVIVKVQSGGGSTATCVEDLGGGEYGKLVQANWDYGAEHSWDVPVAGEKKASHSKPRFRSSSFAPKREFVAYGGSNDPDD